MAHIRAVVMVLCAIFPVLCTAACVDDESCFQEEVQEEMRLAQQRGAQWLQGKRDEANSAAMKGTFLLQTATRTHHKNGKVVQRTVGAFKATDPKTAAKKKQKKERQKP